MPKFSKTERGAIADTLLKQGERLFCEYGLRKVAVEEITKAAGIAKGSFYSFYASKEALYFDILTRCQRDMWQKMGVFLEENAALPPRALVRAAMDFMFALMREYPLIRRTDSETTAVLLRKLPKEVTDHHTGEDTEAVEMFLPYGVRFTRPLPVVAKAFQLLYGAVTLLEMEEDGMAGQVLDVMISALINELVEEIQ